MILRSVGLWSVFGWSVVGGRLSVDLANLVVEWVFAFRQEVYAIYQSSVNGRIRIV